MRQTLFIASLVLFGITIGSGHATAQLISNPNFTQPPAKAGYSYPDYYCTDSKGKRVEMGETACLITGSRRVLARCDISVNSPAWREESEGCSVPPGATGSGSSSSGTLYVPCGSCDARHQRLKKGRSGKD